MALAAFSGDNIFVSQADFLRAWAALQTCIDPNKTNSGAQLLPGLVKLP